MRIPRSVVWLAASVAAGSLHAQEPSRPEITSPLGRPLYALADTAGLIPRAESALAARPDSVGLIIALGVAQASSWQYRRAIETYTRGIVIAPDNALLYRHRGHRYISTRQLDRALADLLRAASLDSTSFDIWYHLGLAHYLLGEFERAARAYRACLRAAATDENRVAASDWLWMALSRAGRHEEARQVLDGIREGMAVSENTAYYRRLLLYKGILPLGDVVPGPGAGDLDVATLGYGIANWHLVRGDSATAFAMFERIVAGRYWPAFGFIAAETELARRR